MSNFKKGDCVIIKSLRCGGEIIDNRGDEGYVVRVAWINPLTGSVDIRSVDAEESDLEPVQKKKGVIIL